MKKLWERIKTFGWSLGMAILLICMSFLGIFIPQVHKAVNTIFLQSARNLIKKYR